MAPLVINVSGESIISRHPERAVLHLAVTSDGPEQETVSKDVTTTSNELHQLFKGLSPKNDNGYSNVDAPVTTFSSTLLRTWSIVPTDEKNKPLDRVHHATSSFEVIFRDFGKLSEVAGKLVAHPKVEIDSIDWRLTDATKKALGSESRKLAIRDAIHKATDYAEVIGQEVVAVEITDGGSASHVRARYMAAAPAPARARGLFGASPQMEDEADTALDLNPQQIEFTGVVDVKFEAVQK
ncbi:hypothetical protein N7448_007554 [Penicillium atrosanguineum]|uniref:SIMPL domain-containing protein n=1 Tax=Penicillium atrosanguineum TaxID=1132637 RepID=A0A9W9GPH9_9EURO|nr:uncharacterized protein N7443_001422 [Penicillium atrosanguineum]KAJ5126775.1 hypothetical protein N7448_007554 [Penicillium atrosanguineum]KAJ5146980.1 hypothetical protein N7526_000332 [Penicillium atrosanguineum]KAJ5314538.1 hypothetical protein N7443_001422 [Penicillium atrosanguineum]KAJ5331709.1 hypothetical protein N7476_001492 [Penicillium atrosanguineum]